jgi:hypothetical protein
VFDGSSSTPPLLLAIVPLHLAVFSAAVADVESFLAAVDRSKWAFGDGE